MSGKRLRRNEKNFIEGGPNKEQNFSVIGDVIYNLIGMKSSINNVSVKTFGLINTSITEEI